MKVFYAGDSARGGSANYLLGILHSMKATVRHVPPGKKLTPSHFKTKWDVIVLSDFGRSDCPNGAQKMIEAQVKAGAGFLMIGGWGSFFV